MRATGIGFYRLASKDSGRLANGQGPALRCHDDRDPQTGLPGLLGAGQRLPFALLSLQSDAAPGTLSSLIRK